MKALNTQRQRKFNEDCPFKQNFVLFQNALHKFQKKACKSFDGNPFYRTSLSFELFPLKEDNFDSQGFEKKKEKVKEHCTTVQSFVLFQNA